MTLLSIRKVGGLWWLRIGRVRIAFCLVRKLPRTPQPTDPTAQDR